MASQYAQRSLQGTLRREDRNKQCPDCKSDEIMYENGERYCKKCGLVLD